MEQALSINELKKRVEKKYEYGEKRIVGIILARYDNELVQKVVNDYYKYWNLNTGRNLDIFWAGYGAYLCPDEQSDTKMILDFKGNNTRVYFDLEAFISVKNEFNEIYPKQYQDYIELILLNYYNGKLHFEESFKINLEENINSNHRNIGRFMEFITNECKSQYNVISLSKKLGRKRLFENVKEIMSSNFLANILSAIGLKG